MSDKPRLAGAALVTVANGTLRAETVAFVILTNSATPSSEIKSVRDGFSRFLPQYWPLSQGEQLWRSIKREFQGGELRLYAGRGERHKGKEMTSCSTTVAHKVYD